MANKLSIRYHLRYNTLNGYLRYDIIKINKEKRPIRHLKLHLLVYSVDFFSHRTLVSCTKGQNHILDTSNLNLINV